MGTNYIIDGARALIRNRLSVFTLLSLCMLHLVAPVADAFHPISSSWISSPPPHLSPGQLRKRRAGAKVRNGEYLAQVGDCLACHTTTGGGAARRRPADPDPLRYFLHAQYYAGRETGLGKWSEADFIKVMKRGIRPTAPTPFRFSYVYFNRITEADLKDLWAYLQAIPAVKRENQGNTLPFRRMCGLPSTAGRFCSSIPIAVTSSRTRPNPMPGIAAPTLSRARPLQYVPHADEPAGCVRDKYYLTGQLIDGYWAPDITKRGLETATHTRWQDVFIDSELINKAGDVRGRGGRSPRQPQPHQG